MGRANSDLFYQIIISKTRQIGTLGLCRHTGSSQIGTSLRQTQYT